MISARLFCRSRETVIRSVRRLSSCPGCAPGCRRDTGRTVHWRIVWQGGGIGRLVVVAGQLRSCVNRFSLWRREGHVLATCVARPIHGNHQQLVLAGWEAHALALCHAPGCGIGVEHCALHQHTSVPVRRVPADCYGAAGGPARALASRSTGRAPGRPRSGQRRARPPVNMALERTVAVGVHVQSRPAGTCLPLGPCPGAPPAVHAQSSQVPRRGRPPSVRHARYPGRAPSGRRCLRARRSHRSYRRCLASGRQIPPQADWS